LENLKDNTYQKVYDFAFDYANRKYRPFTSEDIKSEFIKKHPDVKFKNYGDVMKSLCCKGIIIDTEKMTKAIFPEAKGRKITIWISKNYSDQQSKNRISENKNLPTLFDNLNSEEQC